ncbi:hypothetical protein AYI68_g8038 [Smittium mucronatum]|uniref:Ferric reductase NAD binding domain-containing protein n=1 Tax=Smittium mucronatum TaxID=133383 RepID=A0A1R0GLZ2_9FUNG|nr:hypothetical protein AYI68_g8249 [Smittium mucronatum]OLY77924.1 hypothetical protein AYI68_g8038 [Smittium mucronatum]
MQYTSLLLLFGVLLYVIDRSYRQFEKSRVSKENIRYIRWSESLLEIIVPEKFLPHISSSKKRDDIFGHAYLYIPDISILEWHPFDVSFHADTRFFSFYVSKQGFWTKKLFEIASNRLSEVQNLPSGLNSSNSNHLAFNNETPGLSLSPASTHKAPQITRSGSYSGENSNDVLVKNVLKIQNAPLENSLLLSSSSIDERLSKSSEFPSNIYFSGLYDSDVKYVLENETALIIVSGSGISSIIPLIRHFMFLKSTNSPQLVAERVHLLWSSKHISSFKAIEDLLNEIISLNMTISVSIQLVCTEERVADSNLYKNTLFPRLPEHTSFLFITDEFGSSDSTGRSSSTRITPRLPKNEIDISQIFRGIVNLNYDSNFGVLAVGSDKFVENASASVFYVARNRGIMDRVNFYG